MVTTWRRSAGAGGWRCAGLTPIVEFSMSTIPVSGVVSNSLTADSGTTIEVQGTDVAISSLINSGGFEFVGPGGQASSTTVNNGGELAVSSGGFTYIAVVSSGGTLVAGMGGTTFVTELSGFSSGLYEGGHGKRRSRRAAPRITRISTSAAS